MDFGLARRSDLNTITATGDALGTPAYMAPEQVQGSGGGHRPVFPGVIAFEMLTGRQPFQAPDPVQLMMQHIQQPPPSLLALKPSLPDRLEAVVHRMLAKEPSQRFPPLRRRKDPGHRSWDICPGSGKVCATPLCVC